MDIVKAMMRRGENGASCFFDSSKVSSNLEIECSDFPCMEPSPGGKK